MWCAVIWNESVSGWCDVVLSLEIDRNKKTELVMIQRKQKALWKSHTADSLQLLTPLDYNLFIISLRLCNSVCVNDLLLRELQCII